MLEEAEEKSEETGKNEEEKGTFVPEDDRPYGQVCMMITNEYGEALSEEEENGGHTSNTVISDDVTHSYNLPSTAPAMRLIRAVCRSTLRRLETFHTKIGTTTQAAAEYHRTILQQQMEACQIIPEDLAKHDIASELPNDYISPAPIPQTHIAFVFFTQTEEREIRLDSRRETPQKTLQRLHGETLPPITIPDITLILEEPDLSAGKVQDYRPN